MRRIEDLDQVLDGIRKDAAKVGLTAASGARLGPVGAALQESGGVIGPRPDTSVVRKRLFEDLREVLADEIVVSRALVDGEISEREEHREIAKRALAGVKLIDLRRMAGDLGLARSGNLEQVLDRIIASVNLDREQIARLIVAYETEPPAERRFVTRLFPLAEAVENLDAAAERLRRSASRYVKVGIARWMVVDSVETKHEMLRLRGRYRYYTADAEQGAEDEYTLSASDHSTSAEVRLGADAVFAQVDARGATASRAAAAVLHHASAARTPGAGLTFPGKLPEGSLFGWDPRTVFMVDLLSSNFRSDRLELVNLTTAGFERSTRIQASEEEEHRPFVHSVRFQGEHLLKSVPAASLIVRGHGLVELSLVVRWSEGGADYVLPASVRLDRDHIAATTGFGLNPPGVARAAHLELLAGIERTYAHPLQELAAVQHMANGIRELAQSTGSPDEPRLLSRAPTAQAPG